MAKQSIKARESKRISLVKKYAAKRLNLKTIISDTKVSDEERWNAALKLQMLPRDSSSSRLRNRCRQTGRARGFMRKFGLSRAKFREAAMRGEVPDRKSVV